MIGHPFSMRKLNTRELTVPTRGVVSVWTVRAVPVTAGGGALMACLLCGFLSAESARSRLCLSARFTSSRSQYLLVPRYTHRHVRVVMETRVVHS